MDFTLLGVVYELNEMPRRKSSSIPLLGITLTRGISAFFSFYWQRSIVSLRRELLMKYWRIVSLLSFQRKFEIHYALP